jgi:uncharacterized protein YxeA
MKKFLSYLVALIFLITLASSSFARRNCNYWIFTWYNIQAKKCKQEAARISNKTQSRLYLNRCARKARQEAIKRKSDCLNSSRR